MKQWIKLYTEALHDRKMRRLNRFDKSVFYDLLLLAGQEDQDGQLPCIEDIALELDLKPSEAQKSVTALIKVGLIAQVSNDNFVVTKFKERQESNLSNYERVKRYRDNKKNVINDNADDNAEITDTRYQTVINDNADDTEMITVEKEIEIDKEIDKELTVNADALTDARKTKADRKRAYGSLKNVMLTDEEYSALKDRFQDADDKIEAMSLYFGSHGNAKKYKNHYATALNWARMAAERDSKAPKKAQPVNEYPDMYSRLQAMREAGQI